MRKLLFVAVVLLGAPTSTWADLCVQDTLAAYIDLGAGGCEIDSATVFGFSADPSFFGGTLIDAATIMVVPTSVSLGPRLDFLLTGTAAAGDLLGIAIGYSISSALAITGSTLSMAGSSATGDGVVTVVQDLCPGVFLGDPSTCTLPPPISLAVAQDFVGPTGPDTRTFLASPFFDVFVDITIDGGLAGSAALGGAGVPGMVTNQFVTPVPEPSTVLLLGSGLILVWVGRRKQF
jgi:hypothetical protein